MVSIYIESVIFLSILKCEKNTILWILIMLYFEGRDK